MTQQLKARKPLHPNSRRAFDHNRIYGKAHMIQQGLDEIENSYTCTDESKRLASMMKQIGLELINSLKVRKDP